MIERFRKRGVFKEKKYFQLNFVPEEVYESEEISEVAKFFADFIDYDFSDAIFLVGPSGTGKTLSVRYMIREMRELTANIGVSYLNCRAFSTKYAAIRRIAMDLGIDIPVRGLGTSEAYEKLFERVRNFKKVLIVLDEVEKLRNYDNLIYNLTRASEIYEVDVPISIIFISNNIHLFRILDDATSSSLNMKSIVFDRYNADELYEIIRYRAENGLNSDIYDNAVLRYIAAKSARRSGDARLAISSLYKSAEFCDENDIKITEEVVDKTFKEALEEIELDTLKKIHFHALLILYAMSKMIRKEEESVYVKEVYNKYRRICIELGEEYMSYMHFYNHLSYLQSLDTVLLTKERGSRGGYRISAHLNVPASGVEKVLKERINEMY